MARIEGKADLIMSGGRIWCGLAQGFAEALAARDGLVLAAGAASEIEGLAGPGTRRVELRGRLAMPAFHDAHMHLAMLGDAAKKIDLRPDAVSSMAEVVVAVAMRARATAFMHGQPGWLVDDQHQPVAIEQAREQVVGSHERPV